MLAIPRITMTPTSLARARPVTQWLLSVRRPRLDGIDDVIDGERALQGHCAVVQHFGDLGVVVEVGGPVGDSMTAAVLTFDLDCDDDDTQAATFGLQREGFLHGC